VQLCGLLLAQLGPAGIFLTRQRLHLVLDRLDLLERPLLVSLRIHSLAARLREIRFRPALWLFK